MNDLPPWPPAPRPKPEPVPEGPAQRLCASEELQERGRALVFEVLQFGERTSAFALRFDGRVVAYLNRCVHVPVELDWMPGEFLDSEREYVICSVHGATYAPQNGRCLGGPCGRGSLTALLVEEREGSVYWQPTRDTRPPPPASLP